MENKDTFDMTLPASEIDAALIAAKSAVTYTPKTLTPEQQAQARENIGAGLALIDLDTYGTEPYKLNLVVGGLFLQGGGTMENIPIGNLMEALNTDKPLRVQLTLDVNVLYLYGVSTCKSNGIYNQLAVNGMMNHKGTVYLVFLVIDKFGATGSQNGSVRLTATPVGF